MCLFVLAVAPKSASSVALAEVANRHGRAFAPFVNPHFARALKHNEICAMTTRGHCDCGSKLFASPKRSLKERERDFARLRRKGWGEAKIRDWVESTEPRRDFAHFHAAWGAYVAETLTLPRVPYFGLIGHYFDGYVATDVIPVKDRITHTPSELREGRADLALDVLHVFFPDAE